MILLVLLQLTLVVLAHELGHYLFARLAGVRVVSFNVGFGAKLWSFKRNQTVYALRCIPIGGYVQLADAYTAPDAPPEERYENKSWLARFGVMLGGALGNFVFAWIILYVLAGWYERIFITSIYTSLLNLLNLLIQIWQGIILLFTEVGLAGLSGPVGIITTSIASNQNGVTFFCWLFTAFLSVNLGVFNLLPFPGLDGGRLIFLWYELIFRRKPNPTIERWVNAIGVLLLFSLIIFVSFQDFARL